MLRELYFCRSAAHGTLHVTWTRCHVCEGTSSLLCAHIRAECVQAGRRVLELQQHQRSHHLNTHTHTHRWKATCMTWRCTLMKWARRNLRGRGRWLYEQHSSEIPRLKVVEAATKPSEESLWNLRGLFEGKYAGMQLAILQITPIVRIFSCILDLEWRKYSTVPVGKHDCALYTKAAVIPEKYWLIVYLKPSV